MRLAVNPESGPLWRENPVTDLRVALPAADVRELRPDDDLVAVLATGLDEPTTSWPSGPPAGTAR